MRTLVLATLAVVVMAGIAAADDMAPFFPAPQEVAGWSISADIQTYPGKKVYDLIDGAGEVFMSYNFDTAATKEYTGPNDGIISVEIYQMKTVEDAYGIYAYNRSRSAKSDQLDIPQAAFMDGAAGGLWKDRFYVHVFAQEDKPGVAESVKGFLTTISRRISSEGKLPDLFSAMELEGYKKGSARYLHTPLALKNLHFVSDENVLRLESTTQMVIADYSVKGRDFTGFVVVYPTAQAAIDAAASYSKFIGAHPETEAAWFKQFGKAVCGVWAGMKAKETPDSQDVLFAAVQDLISRVHVYQLEK
jgi:hypothetical protein